MSNQSQKATMELTEDLKLIALLGQEDFDRALSLYATTDEDQVEVTLQLRKMAERDDSGGIKALIRFLEYLTDNVIDARSFSKQLEKVEELVKQLADSEQEVLDGWNRIKEQVGYLTEHFVARKRAELKNRYSRVTRFQVTTDLRPLFNLERTSVEELLICNVLKIETSDEKTVLCEFYDDLIDDLIEELELTKKKIEILRNKYVGN